MLEKIKRVDGIQAVVLGGSRARGIHTPASDIDLGLYYHPDTPPDLAALNQVATELDDDHRPNLLTPLGGWGPWINGGGWLIVHSLHVDFLYRNLKQISAVIEACRAGQVEVAYQPGHPQGFVSAMYLGEVAVCRLLWEAGGELTRLKALASPYPPKLKQALIEKFAWEIDFSLDIARKGVERKDVTYMAGCFFRAVACMLQVLFALNEQYWLNEKGAVALAETFALRPPGFQARTEAAFALLAADSPALQRALDILDSLAGDVRRLIS